MDILNKQAFLHSSIPLIKSIGMLLELNTSINNAVGRLINPSQYICCARSQSDIHVLEKYLLDCPHATLLRIGNEFLDTLPNKSVDSIFVHLDSENYNAVEWLLTAVSRVAWRQIVIQAITANHMTMLTELNIRDDSWHLFKFTDDAAQLSEVWAIKTFPEPEQINLIRKTGVVSVVFPPQDSGQAIMLQRLLHNINPAHYTLISSRNYHASRFPYSTIPHRNSALGGRFYQIATTEPIIRGRRFMTPNLREIIAFFIKVVGRARQIANILRQEKCAGVIGCSGDIFDFPAAFVASKLARLPFYAYMFDYYSFQSVIDIHRKICVFLERVILQNATKVIVPNDFLGECYRVRYGVDYTTVHNPLELGATIATQVKPWPAQYGEIRLVYTGQVYEAQFDALSALVQALELLGRSDIRLYIYTAQPIETIQAHGICGPVVFHPHQPPERVRELQQEADVLFLPLGFNTPYPEIIKTSAPSKMGEYLASGRPILVHVPSDSFVSWYFKKYECGAVVDQENPALLAEAIREISENPIYREKLVRNAKLRAEMDFEFTKVQTQFISLLNTQ
jgi:glycosyltransferase involved in cell wall biosynthesis